MILMGLVIIWGARMPFLMRERRFHFTPRSFTASEVLLLGMAFGFGWTPCFGPILASILVYTSTAETVREGTLLLAAYSLGLGLPFLLAGLGLGQLQGLLRAVRRHAQLVVSGSGATLILLGLLFVSGQMYHIAIAGERLLSRL
jgi:cytochrome c-type biogenesis protein